jgi:hypothetical protein
MPHAWAITADEILAQVERYRQEHERDRYDADNVGELFEMY